MNGFHTYLGMVLFVGWFLWFWRISQRWIIPSVGAGLKPAPTTSDEQRAPSHGLKTTPAVVSGMLVLALAVGHDMAVPKRQSVANCEDDVAFFSYRSEGDLCNRGKTRVIEGTPCQVFPPPEGFGTCLAGPITEGPNWLQQCGDADTSALYYAGTCLGTTLDGEDKSCGTFSFYFNYRGTECGKAGYDQYTMKLVETVDTNCQNYPSCYAPSAPETPDGCHAFGSIETVKTENCVPEFPAFFPFLFSLLAPLLRWRWRG